MKEMYF